MKVSSAEKLGIGIVGLGGIVQTTHLPSLKEIKEIELVAVCDLDGQKAAWVGNKFKVPNVVHELDDLLKLDSVDAILICTPTNLHYPMATRAMRAGKHVFIEKPLAKNLKEAQRIIKISEDTGKLAMVGMNHRFRHDAVILKDFVDSGELGRIFYAKSGWMIRRAILDKRRWCYRKEVAGGGVLIDLGIQMVDLMLWLMDSPNPKSVLSTAYNLIEKLEVEDSASIQIVCDNKATINVEVTWSLMTEREVNYANVFGTEGGALLNPLRIHKELAGNMVNVTPDHAETQRNLFRRSYRDELRHFVDCLRDGLECRSTAKDAIPSIRVIDAAYRSIAGDNYVRIKASG